MNTESGFIPSGLYSRLDLFWQKWGEVLLPITSGPYFRLAKKGNETTILQDLVAATQISGDGLIVEVGCGESLSPLTTAQLHNQSTVIALDPYSHPLNYYPDVGERRQSGNCAFFFPLSVTDVNVQTIMKETAWRVQLVAPEHKPRHKHLLRLIAAAAELVAPGGEMIVTGDGFKSGSRELKRLFDLKTFSPLTESFRLASTLKQTFDTFNIYDLRAEDLWRLYGVSGRWFSPVTLTGETREIWNGRHKPGIAVLGGKKGGGRVK